jgi:ABC-2 type transport system permease protein
VSSYTGTPTLLRFVLRNDRVRIPVWVLGIGLSVMGSVASFASTYPTAADRQARADVLSTPVASLFVGPGFGLDNYTFGAMTAHELLPLTSLAAALMSIFLVVRHTRAEEETGRTDLVRATEVGRQAGLAAALIAVVGANLVLGVLLAVGLPLSLDGLSAAGSIAFAGAVVGVGLVFAGVAALTAQLTVSARAAAGAASIAMGAAYVLRAVGDMGNGVLSWLSPFGWATESRAYVQERWWVMVLPVGATIVLIGVAFAVNARRDVGAGLLADRPGPATAPSSLRSSVGLAWRLQRVTLAWWAASLFLLGLVYGGVAEQAGKLYENVSSISKYLARIGASDAPDQYLALALFISALVAAGFAIQSTLRLRSEEVADRAEPLLATPVSRDGFVTSHLLMAMVGSVVLMLACGLGMGISHAVSINDAGEIPRLMGAGLVYAPGLWVFAAFAVALFGLVPRATAAAWIALGVLAFIGFLGPLLKLPDWMFDLSPIEHVPRLPVADFSLGPVLLLTLVAAALTAAGIVGFRHREVGTA